MDFVKLAEVTRGDLVESIHYGAVAVCNTEGKLIAQAGNADYVTYIRSAAKPFQALSLLENQADLYFDFSKEELALMASSHSGEEEHIKLLEGLLKKINVPIEEMKCGYYSPFCKSKEPLTALHSACSGKHAGMLALARFKHWPTQDYLHINHPVQQLLLNVSADFADIKPQEIPLGIDGCGVPVYAMPLWRMALSYARLSEPSGLALVRKEACRRLVYAMTQKPFFVAGTKRLATDLMNVLGSRCVAKDGSEGIFCMGLPEKGWGIAVKIADGNPRAAGPIVIELLSQLGLLTDDEKDKLAMHRLIEIKNAKNDIIGEIHSVVPLV